jgi:hypothetical protein
MTAPGDVIYWVNDQDSIVFVNEEWDRFAVANAGERITSAHVLDRPLWDYIADSTTRELYRQLLRRVRGGSPVCFNFRCDSPTCRRLLGMEVAHREDGAVEFRTHTLWERAREPAPPPAAIAVSAGQLVRVCGWCKKMFAGGSWEEVEVAVARLQLFERPLPLSLTHGICEECYRTMLETLARP